MAGLKPEELWRSYLPDVLRFIKAYDKKELQFFNFNTKTIAWYAMAPHVKNPPSFESFLVVEADNDVEDWQEAYKKQVERLTQLGIIKPRARA